MKEQQLPYSYRRSLKSPEADELINLYVMRPLAGRLIRLLYPTSVTPNHLTCASLLAGMLAAFLLLEESRYSPLLAGIFITLKDILDSADGQLARARNEFSRFGRFFDSLVDVIVNALLFTALGYTLAMSSNTKTPFLLAFLGFIGTTFRVSYHVFYYVSYLHRRGAYTTNKLIEDTNNDRMNESKGTVIVHWCYHCIYGWQDRLMAKLDRWCSKGLQLKKEKVHARWYEDKAALFLSGLQGLGTELFFLMLGVVSNNVRLYLYWNVFVLNSLWGVSIVYRRYILRNKLMAMGLP